jgi:hypothetical protein
MSTERSRDSPLATPAKKPAAKASPAPVVSAISDLLIAWTGNDLALDGNNGGLGALGDDGDTLALLVLLWKVGEVLGDSGDVGSLQVVRLGVGGGLGLVADNVVPVGSGLVELLLEELRNERCVQGESEGLFMVSIFSTCGFADFEQIIPCSPWQPPRPKP